MIESKLPDELLFVQVPGLMFNINLVQGLEFRKGFEKVVILFKNGKYLTKKITIEEFIEISSQFLMLIDISKTLKRSDYVVFMNIIFTVKKLTAIEYRDPSSGLAHAIIFKDGQYLLPFLKDSDFKKMYNLTQKAIFSNVIEKEGI